MILNVDFALKHSNYIFWKLFICLKLILIQSTILHTQFNHHTLPVTPFKKKFMDIWRGVKEVENFTFYAILSRAMVEMEMMRIKTNLMKNHSKLL